MRNLKLIATIVALAALAAAGCASSETSSDASSSTGLTAQGEPSPPTDATATESGGSVATPTLSSVALSDGIVEVDVIEVDTGTARLVASGFDVHFCSGEITSVFAGPYTPGDEISYTCYASEDSLSESSLNAMAVERTTAPQVGDSMVVALWPMGDTQVPAGTLGAEALEYDAASGLVGIKDSDLTTAATAALRSSTESNQIAAMDSVVADWHAGH